MVPEFKKAAEQLKDSVTFAAVDCQTSQTICQQLGVRGYPTIKWLQLARRLASIQRAPQHALPVGPVVTRRPSNRGLIWQVEQEGENVLAMADYQGQRDAVSIVKFAQA